MNLQIKVNTYEKTVELYFEGIKFTEAPISYFDEKAGLPRKILLKESAGNGTHLRLDNFFVYYDYTSDLRETFESVKNDDVSSEDTNDRKIT